MLLSLIVIAGLLSCVNCVNVAFSLCHLISSEREKSELRRKTLHTEMDDDTIDEVNEH